MKNILCAMLSEKFRVLATPESYNTPMGIAKSVKNLDSTHDVFIAEMGARRTGDIKKLMKIVRPTHSVLTAINEQHLQTFGSREAIAAEKLRVLDIRSEDGVCVVNDALIRYEKVRDDKNMNIILAGESETSPVRCSDIAVCENGSVFRLSLFGREIECSTVLLGVHNIVNITLAAAMAYRLGVSPEQIRNAVYELEPTPHRLQLIEGNGIKIIDDYAHHPSEIKTTLESAKNASTGRLVAIFQPHRYSRLKGLWNNFLKCFDSVDKLFVLDVYAASEDPIEGINSEKFVQAMNSNNAKYISGSVDEAALKIAPELQSGDFVITLGAGDITKIGKAIESSRKAGV